MITLISTTTKNQLNPFGGTEGRFSVESTRAFTRIFYDSELNWNFAPPKINQNLHLLF